MIFLEGCDYAFLDDLLATLSVKDRRRCLKNTILKFKDDARAIRSDKQVQEQCGLRPVAMKMSKADAVLLFYSGNYSEQQWDKLASAVNQLMEHSTRSAFGH
jgi:hypothetical protein